MVKIILYLEIELYTIAGSLQITKKHYHKYIFSTKSDEKEVLHVFLDIFVKYHIFAYLTLKLTH